MSRRSISTGADAPRAADSDDGAELLAARPRDAAPRLLGWRLTVDDGDGVTSGRIVEVEAYEGSNDPASHAHTGPTSRNKVMFAPAGCLYVYRSYGVHWCANVVCGSAGQAGAVLIRAVEPTEGIEHMWPRRPKARTVNDLASGPGKLCAALGIDGRHNGVDLLDPRSPVRLLPPPTEPGVGEGARGETRVLTGPRVGISKATGRPWRFGLAGNPHLSRPFR